MTAEARQKELQKVVAEVRKRFRETGVILILTHKKGPEVYLDSVAADEGIVACEVTKDRFLRQLRLLIKGGQNMKKAKTTTKAKRAVKNKKTITAKKTLKKKGK